MKNTLLIIVTFVFLFLSAFAAKTSAQIAGGYGKADANSTEVKTAARLAVDSESRKYGKKLKLVSISEAEQQVVAGMNYKICLKVRDGRKIRTATTVVYRSLKPKYSYSLTSWDWDKCSL